MTGSHERFIFFRRLPLHPISAPLFTGLMAFGLLCAPQTRGQSQDAANPPSFAFEVASIKPDHLDGHSTRISYDTDSLLTSGVTLKRLIAFAYNIGDFQISGGPAWADSETYQIQARIDHETAVALSKLPREQTNEQRRVMVQKLLEERFNLKVTHSTKELPIYALMVAKNGPKLSPAAATDQGQGAISNHNGELTIKAATMSRFAGWLSLVVDRKVVDKTGLEGRYDFAMKYDNRRQALVATLPGEGTPAALSDSSGPSIFTALHDQLGLQLESQKGPVETLIIDSAEKPSPD